MNQNCARHRNQEMDLLQLRLVIWEGRDGWAIMNTNRSPKVIAAFSTPHVLQWCTAFIYMYNSRKCSLYTICISLVYCNFYETLQPYVLTRLIDRYHGPTC